MSYLVFNPFKASSSLESGWFFAGLSSSFPDIGSDDGNLSLPRECNSGISPGCKVFHLPKADGSQWSEMDISEEELASSEMRRDLKHQVLVFQYRGKFYAVNHQCPHSLYPLSQSVPFDIEDFGIVLSAGLTCPRHGWSFDLFTGMGDRGNYKLGLWEVQLRDVGSKGSLMPIKAASDASNNIDKEVWVRQKQRIG